MIMYLSINLIYVHQKLQRGQRAFVLSPQMYDFLVKKHFF